MKKKILIVADTYAPRVDGIMRFLHEVLPRIADDFAITLLVPDYGVSWTFNERKVKLSRIVRLAGYQSLQLSLRNLRTIRDAVKEADTVFIQGPALISVLALHYARNYHKTALWYIHLILWELYEKNLPRLLRRPAIPLFKRLVLSWYNTCDALIVPYKSLVRELTQLGITTKKDVARLGVDSELLRPPEDKAAAKQALGIPPNRIVVGYVGRISREKNVEVLVEAVQRLQQDYPITLLAVGSGTEHMMKLFENTKNTVLPGFVRDVERYYQAMDIFVMPSLTETTSLATLEAMACGVPVVTTKVGFLKEYVIKNHNGLLFPRGNVYTLVLQLHKLIRRKRLRRYMGVNARQTALQFSWDKTAARIKGILERY